MKVSVEHKTSLFASRGAKSSLLASRGAKVLSTRFQRRKVYGQVSYHSLVVECRIYKKEVHEISLPHPSS